MRAFAMIGAIVCAWVVSTSQAAAQSRWVEVETPGFIVYAQGSERRAQDLADQLEEFDGLLRRMTGAPAERSPTKLEVYMFSSDQFHNAFPTFSDGIAGVYIARTERIAAYSIASANAGISAQDVLFHEYAHHFMYQYFNNAYPAWYIEGFAEVVSTAVLGSERIVIGRSNEGRVYSLRSGTWLPMERLISTSTSQIRDGGDMASFYAQSWLFAHYILLTPGAEAQFRAYVRAQRMGRSPTEAFQDGFGITPEAMQARLRQYFRGNPNAIALNRPALVARPQMTVTQLPPSSARLMPISARLTSANIRDADRAATLAEVRQLVGSAPSDDFALFTLARAEIRLGSTEAARALLEPYLTAHPDDRDALYFMGWAYLREAENAEGDARTALLSQARRHLSRGYRIDGNHVPTLARYAETYSNTTMSQATYENYLNILLLARQLAPQVDEISLNAANVLLSSNRTREAIPILRALAYDPHGGGAAETAQRLLTEAESSLAAEPAN